MKLLIVALVLVSVIIYICSNEGEDVPEPITVEETANNRSTTEHFLDTSGGIEIHITIDGAVGGAVEIMQVESKKPGLKNPIETAVTLKNTSGTSLEVLVEGKWEDARGNGFGGINSPLTLRADEGQTITAGTHSKNVTVYKVSITDNRQTGMERLAEVLSDPTIKIAEGNGMTYSATALDEIIPALPIFGFANGDPFEGLTVTFNYDFGKWRVEVSDDSFDPVKGSVYARHENSNLQTISVDLPQEPEAGGKMGREMEYGGGMFQIRDPGKAVPTTSWNTSLAYVIEFQEWSKGESAEGSCAKREIGSASGKLYIAFQGSDFTFENSWVSGQFRDVPVIYCGVSGQ
ncbi:MAG: hypothetical protein ACI9JM_001839 [Halioglobus sp.]|jgi:hypothetical protein